MKVFIGAGLLFMSSFFLLSSGCKTPANSSQGADARMDKIISVKEVSRIENTLAGDEMRGRRAGTPDIDRAADFIASEFKRAGLQPINGSSYLQQFSLINARLLSTDATLDGTKADPANVIVITTQPAVHITDQSGYAVQHLEKGQSLSRLRDLVYQDRNTIVFVDTSFAKSFSRIKSLRGQLPSMHHSLVFILGNEARQYSINAEHSFTETKYTNVVGTLPGKSRKGEYVIFSGHYDHLGVGKAVNNDSIFNGANDDAAGTTAVILLANYYKALNNNERTLVFAAFTAEEVGGFGSQYFSRQYNPDSVMAMFNIEMIGTESKWGKNSAYITGYEKTNMGAILQRNLEGTGFTFYPDPYTTQQLFYRSDNATLARQGVPAHTISTSKMDSEPNYHRQSDEVSTLSMDNMTMIIKAIARSAVSIISGKDTPSRVDTKELR